MQEKDCYLYTHTQLYPIMVWIIRYIYNTQLYNTIFSQHKYIYSNVVTCSLGSKAKQKLSF